MEVDRELDVEYEGRKMADLECVGGKRVGSIVWKWEWNGDGS